MAWTISNDLILDVWRPMPIEMTRMIRVSHKHKHGTGSDRLRLISLISDPRRDEDDDGVVLLLLSRDPFGIGLIYRLRA